MEKMKVYWVEPKKILAGQTLFTKEQKTNKERLSFLAEQGIKTIITLQSAKEIPGDSLSIFADKAIQQVHFPITDFGLPSKELALQVLDKIEEEIANDRPVYIHCYAGIGRTGTIVGCHLQRKGITDANNVFETIQALREAAQLPRRKSPETDAQEAFVLNWRKDQ